MSSEGQHGKNQERDPDFFLFGHYVLHRRKTAYAGLVGAGDRRCHCHHHNHLHSLWEKAEVLGGLPC